MKKFTKKEQKELQALEGTLLIFTNPNYLEGKEITVKLALFDYGRGCSIVAINDPDDHYVCFHGPDYNRLDNRYNPKQYDDQLRFTLEAVKNGHFDIAQGIDDGLFAPASTMDRMPTCAFE